MIAHRIQLNVKLFGNPGGKGVFCLQNPWRRGSGASGNTGGSLGGGGWGVIKRAHLSGLCGFFTGISY